MSTSRPHVIAGGGIMGLAIGWQLLRAGHEVEIYEEASAARSGASWVAAGMLAPQAEAGYEEEALFRLCTEGLALYPKFLCELAEDVTEHRVPDLDRCGSLIVAITADDKRLLDRQYEYRKQLGCTGMRMLTGAEAREREPLLSPKVKAALLLEDEAQINNRALCEALREAFLRRGGTLHEFTRVDRVITEDDSVVAIEVKGQRREVASLTVAAGALAARIDGVEAMGLRPVKGQVITLRAEFAQLGHLIRSPRVYLAAKDDQRLVVGASVEEKGADRSVTAGPVMELLHYAWEAVPAVYELEIMEIQAGLRPASRDHCPMLGEGETKGLYYAVGHYRNGILLTPLTAYALADDIGGKGAWPELAVFGPTRFAQVSAGGA